VFSGYTGDCAPVGRTSMTEPRTCGATFDQVATPAATATFRLTITKPEGGTVVGNGGIYCGTSGAMCTADIPSGVPVSLKAEADARAKAAAERDARLNVVRTGEPVAQGGAAAQLATEEAARKAAADLAAQQKAAQDAAARDLGM